MRTVLFWACAVACALYLVAWAYLDAHGVSCWPAVVMAAYMLACAYLQDRLKPRDRGARKDKRGRR